MKKVCVMIVVIKKDFLDIQCFNKKVMCEFCNKELNKSYLRSHVKKQHVPQHYNQDDKHTTAQLRTQLCDSSRDSSRTNINTGGDLLPARQLSRKLPQLRDSFRTHNNNDNNNNINNNNKCNRTIIVGPSFCGKTHL